MLILCTSELHERGSELEQRPRSGAGGASAARRCGAEAAEQSRVAARGVKGWGRVVRSGGAHVHGRLGHLDEDAVVHLAEAEQLEDLAGLRVHVVDTAEADHEEQLRGLRDVEVPEGAGLALEAEVLALGELVLLDVRGRVLEGQDAGLLPVLLRRDDGIGVGLGLLVLGGGLLEEGLRERHDEGLGSGGKGKGQEG